MKHFHVSKNFIKTIKNSHFSPIYRTLTGLNLWNEELSSSIKSDIENYWSKKLHSPIFNEHDNQREKYYILAMFPYPSGHLHMGHVRVYTISDAVARFQRMNGKNVIHPIGWDAFGLPAENAAIERKVSPHDWTEDNITHMKTQLQQLGCSFEWHRELSTCDPNYYRWTQELFLKLYEAGLVYQKEALVNWDPVDQTVLANEQVDGNGCSWRSGVPVERKFLRQWFIRTTFFAKDLYDGLNDSILHDWRDIIKIQRHWIGECDGVSFDFKIENKSALDFITLWTSHPEYIESANFIAISSDNILAKQNGIHVQNETVKLKNVARNPFNNKIIPIFVTDQIEFLPETDSHLGIAKAAISDKQFCNQHGIDSIDSETLLSEEDIKNKQQSICNLAQKLCVGGYWTSSKLKDWLISRQRYWGTPIPIVHCKNCGVQTVPRNDLPVKLPDLKILSQKGTSQLAEHKAWVSIHCPKCNAPAQRETDTMDTFVDSSWYYLRYLDPANTEEIFSLQKAKKMMPVDLYIGGKEHAVLHLYYARFISHFLYSLGLLANKEPFKRLLVQGMVMGKSYKVKSKGNYVPENDVKIIDAKRNKAVTKNTGEPVIMSWEKMSKSKYNGVDPIDMFKEYSIDTTRLLILADVSPTSHRNWNSNTFPGILNWQKRLWLTIRDFLKHRNSMTALTSEKDFKSFDDYMFDSRNFYVKGATFNYCISQQLSVAISKMQGLTNSIRKMSPAIFCHSSQFERALACQIILIAPIAPHFASELWAGFVSAPNRLNKNDEIQWEKSVLQQNWPIIDSNYHLDLVCQVNGVENAVVKIKKSDIEQLSKNDAVDIALNQNKIQESLEQRTVTDIQYTFHKEYEGVINIFTSAPIKKEVIQG